MMTMTIMTLEHHQSSSIISYPVVEKSAAADCRLLQTADCSTPARYFPFPFSLFFLLFFSFFSFFSFLPF